MKITITIEDTKGPCGGDNTPDVVQHDGMIVHTDHPIDHDAHSEHPESEPEFDYDSESDDDE